MNREAKIGLFVLLAAATLVYFIMRTSDVQEAFFNNKAPKREVKLLLEDASGVRNDTAVRIAGVRVGKVLRVELEGSQAVAVIQVPEEMQFLEEAHAELQSQGVLGERYVSLYLGSGAVRGDQSTLNAKAPTSLDDLTNKINALTENLITITDNIKNSTQTDTGANRLETIAENFEKLTESLVALVQENRGNFKSTTSEIAVLSQTLNRDIPLLVQEMTTMVQNLRDMATGNRPNVDETMGNVAELSENMNRVSESLASIAKKVDEGDGTLGQLVNEGATVEKLNNLLDTANEGVAEVKKIVDRALETEIDLQFRAEYLPEHSASRIHFGLLIRPDDNKYYQVEGVGRDTDYLLPSVSEEREDVFDADGNLLTTTVRSRTEDPDDVVFNGILAYRFGDFYLKGGVFESEGGGGFDWFSDDERIKVSLTAFDFGRDNYDNPHGKLLFRYRYGRTILLHAGWDEFLESDLSSATIGGGIRWKDDDLKTLIATLGRFGR